MDFDDAHTLLEGGEVGTDFEVETAWAEEGIIHYFYSVGGSNDQNIAIFIETIHLDEKLVDR